MMQKLTNFGSYKDGDGLNQQECKASDSNVSRKVQLIMKFPALKESKNF